MDRLLRAGLRQHPLDPCCFLIYETDSKTYDEKDEVHQQVSSLGPERLVGMLIMHVDDMLGSDCTLSPRYPEVIKDLKNNFSFREWKEDLETLEYCGCELQSRPEGGRKLHQGTTTYPRSRPSPSIRREPCQSHCMKEKSHKFVAYLVPCNGPQFRIHHICSAPHPCSQARSPRPPCRPCMNATSSCASVRTTKTLVCYTTTLVTLRNCN